MTGDASSTPSASTPAARPLADDYFHEMYAADDDPWGFADRWYERRKYALTLASLTSERYRRVFEPGCSIGVLSAELALCADHLLCMDLSPRAIELAKRRLARYSGHVEVLTGNVVGDWPAGEFDLIVLSEILYYLTPEQLDMIVDRLPGSLTADGEVVVVHWRHTVAEYPQSGDEVHDRLLDSTLVHCAGYRDADLRLDLFSPQARGSVAQRDGLVG
ncbi:methyltransferase domain-containing protein [Gordonia sp. SID5947]|uniref:SAM-dependent methyltransferase n=1 Tax=Gordonia sp. SID5947 TaxID=2690315 RepID=UPI0013688358|nr:class I SAM-dependent methyltransferase [Gordonia sp. SID5947]MYR07504.1 methyltransferase domain-containing protein [Gordonia sp. SID5947]